ncbi:hypothetical protein [Acidithiobacillus sp. HP-11]|uniref:hypothetical protein n=1 Tax=Acidithiobacillus sp. HP-11 TaxID=2697656 RepID=UPI00187A425D|nr:hypothetical protein [Acidithiobacillus sp. HP-11]MBE7566359.1 hypothetical protein [Acidithiobacillus sp. HP-11]
MISTAKDASRLGTLIQPNGTRPPITGVQSEGKISVTGIYMEFETTIGAAIAFGYSLEDATPALSEAWDNAAARRQAQPPLAIHFGS